MIWNWQHKNWPHFTYSVENFLEYERQSWPKKAKYKVVLNTLMRLINND